MTRPIRPSRRFGRPSKPTGTRPVVLVTQATGAHHRLDRVWADRAGPLAASRPASDPTFRHPFGSTRRPEAEPGGSRAGSGRPESAVPAVRLQPSMETGMNFIAPRAEPLIREIPLSRLSLAPENVRKTPPDPRADAELKASIAALGLLENLVVRAEAPADDGTERYAVVAGGRRLKAIQALVEDGVFDTEHPVPCQVRSGDAEPSELSLAENVMRVAMHPADQVAAFSELAKAGQSVSSIAARFGASERIVEQRLRLGNAAPELLDAYRAGEIDLEVLKAFAVTTDRERQMAVWEQVSGQGYRPAAWQVKRLLTEERVPGASAIARFVGVEAYEAAGGQVLRDLFANDDESGVWFEDPVLLEKLATERLRTAADELATRWKWATAMIEVEWRDTASYGRIDPQPVEPTAGEQAEIDRLGARQAELAELDDDEWTEELVGESEAVEARLSEMERIIDARAVFRREDLAMAGCIVTIGHDGAMQVIQGLVKPEDMPKPEETGEGAAAAGNGHDPHAAAPGARVPAMSPPMAPPKDREAEARKEAGVGIGLADDLRHIRTALVKAYLGGDFGAAFDLVLFQMGRSVFAAGYVPHALDIAFRETADRPTVRMNDADFADWSPGEAMMADCSGLSLDWLEIGDDGESFAALRALPVADKQALFAACVARTVNPQLAFEPQARPELEATVARLDIDFASHVRPTAAMLWSRIAKARILDIARTVFGIAWASARAKTRKPALAEAMEAAFAAGDRPVSLSAGMHAAALAWTPPGFAAFDTGRIGDDADGAPGDSATEADTAEAEGTAAPEASEPAVDAGPASTDAPPAAGGNGHAAPAEPAAPESEGGDAAAGDAGEAAAAGTATCGTAVPDDLAAAIDAANRVPTADGGPRVVVAHVGAGQASDPAPANGHDPSGDPLEIPEFLRRVR
ncbi:MAG: ParB/RepB/Spo0J family partition protein [Rhodospirillaceae bacterium]|nr:ParB/RepB/Spo0J family partition protein [Rhodospirillaceae bacterium]